MIKYKTNYNHFEILITNTEMKGSFYYSNKCEFNLHMIMATAVVYIGGTTVLKERGLYKEFLPLKCNMI
jgi:hypothetical protein